MLVKPLSAEQDLSTATTLSDANCVRLYNNSGNTAVITNDTTGGSFSMPDGSITFMVKSTTDEISSSATVKATPVAFTIS